ncbi:MAG: hypothetical protein LCH90_08075 [Proteobacteria bacterium]|nr:hypothetical protein [Pseudomonadota bacterium]
MNEAPTPNSSFHRPCAKSRAVRQIQTLGVITTNMSRVAYQEYRAASDRGTCRERVICMLLTSPDDILNKNDNFVLRHLRVAEIAGAIGLYFYRFAEHGPFIKIGECTRTEGIAVRFQRGWHSTEKYSDNYARKKKDGNYVDSEFAMEIKKISETNPAYFVFYEHETMHSHPKIDEVYAYRMHKRFFGAGTLSPERMNSNPLLARRLVWHKSAFSEVLRCQLPDGTHYPQLNDA